MGHLEWRHGDPYKTVCSLFSVLKGMRSVLLDVVLVIMSSRSQLSPTVNERTPSQQIVDPRSRRCNTQSSELRRTAPKTACGLVHEITHPAVELRGGGGLFRHRAPQGLSPGGPGVRTHLFRRLRRIGTITANSVPTQRAQQMMKTKPKRRRQTPRRAGDAEKTSQHPGLAALCWF